MFPVFVYGTLRRGGTANHVLNGCEFVKQVKTDAGYELGKLDDLPGMVYTGRNAQVLGDLYNLTPAQMQTLIRYEDKRYRLENIPLETGRWAKAFLLPDANAPVDSSDWG
jgi:gamma-glutamylcyclotransferase (GGCT)/AIG2-like uncharacterized protein YtfP